MELFINDTPIDVTPSEQDTVQTMLDSITKELEEGLIIASMEIDDEFFSIDDPAILRKNINSIKKVSLIVATNIEISLSLIEECKEFIRFSALELKNGSLTKKDQMLQAFMWTLKSLEAIKHSLDFPPTDFTMINAELNHVIKQLTDDHVNIDNLGAIANQLDNIFDLLATLQSKINTPEIHTSENVINKIKETITLLPDLASDFQMGNDLKAIQNLCLVIDTIEMYARYAASNHENKELEGHAIDLKDLSSQMLVAFENKDFILIADLLEYDLSEKFDDILQEG